MRQLCHICVTFVSQDPRVIMEIKIPSVGEAHQGFPKVTTSKAYKKREYASGITKV
jgi:hypothetical protein